MNSAIAPTVAAIVLQLALGLAVFQSHPRRKSNQSFLLLSIVFVAWLACLYLIFTAKTTEAAAFFIRQVSVAGAVALYVFNILRLSLSHPNYTWSNVLRRTRIWLLLLLAITAICQTPFFLRGAVLSEGKGASAPVPIYGSGVYLYSLYFAAAAIALLVTYISAARKASGREKTELAFISIGTVATLAFTLLGLLLRNFVHQSIVNWLAPFRIVVFSLVIAYGITTRKIMDVGQLFRRSMAYILLTAYLLAVYGVVWWLVSTALTPFPGAASSIAHIIAGIVIAFAMAPARGVSQTLADRLFVGSRRLDFRTTVNKATAILRSVTTLDELLEKFANMISEAVDTDRAFILLPSRIGYVQQYPAVQPGTRVGTIEFSKDDALIAHLGTHQEPLVLDELHRIRLTPQLERVAKQMEGLQVAVAMAIFSREHLAGVMLLGPRLSGRIYGSAEQNALQVLCGQMAVAIENAQLFTEVQNAKIYNEILLQNLTTGVVAAGADNRISVFNQEAAAITGMKADGLIDQSIGHLPGPLQTLLRETLTSGERQENKELELDSDEGTVIARASSSIFHGQEGQMLGALVVLTDITALKRLELQIRRSDRLASLGTLSAGMAHEIKNPLVSIKTFAQLLPERYQDSDFRETFSNLIGHEIDRIDSLVNQLLRFARPAKPLLKPLHVHEVLEKSLMLVAHRLYQKEIKLSRVWKADVDTVRADGDQIEQVFLNFFLNAMDAMKHGGELTVTTEIGSANEFAFATNGANGTSEVLRITVGDNGEGIREDHLAHVFDPFFTTKDYGTGLGLSVVHGIIQEHGGQIEVESELAKGTSFHILLPLVRFVEEVAAA
ncbi:MAG: ATP-binding protein [Verrucomicrobiota bacterium]|nr:ATP-binding protein [Verrucomicrobiota bacterium]MDQ6938795.1 ATP-binding protein [Verrucomicrobiota bacterium]